MRLVADLATHLTNAGTLPRAAVLLGAPGMGTSTIVQHVQAAVIERGCLALTVCDDVDRIGTTHAQQLEARLDVAARPLLVAGRSLPTAMRDLLARRFDHRVATVPPMGEGAAHELLEQFGIEAWSFHARQIVRIAAGNPGVLIDAALTIVPTVTTQELPGATLRPLGARTSGMLDGAALVVLTRREREIAQYVAGGLTNPEIAAELHLSPRTVEHHVSSILRKLELPSRRALVRGVH